MKCIVRGDTQCWTGEDTFEGVAETVLDWIACILVILDSSSYGMSTHDYTSLVLVYYSITIERMCIYSYNTDTTATGTVTGGNTHSSPEYHVDSTHNRGSLVPECALRASPRLLPLSSSSGRQRIDVHCARGA